jgi:hypothetical protein
MSGGALDASVTLHEVLTVVGTKRVPLAPELAGYLVLEISEHADPSGDVDPKSVFVSEEGTVALVKSRRGGSSGDAEASIRAVLGRLLEASGSQTPALAVASKRKNGAGLAALAAELEAALIPVNRSAGRRALARLAREVKRVMLGVGRHTLPSSSSLRSSGDAATAPAGLRQPASTPASEPPPSPRRPSAAPKFAPEEDPTTARSRIPNELLGRATPTHWSETPTTEFVPRTPEQIGGARANANPLRPPTASQADVDRLIAQFGVSGDNETHARALKAMAGLEPTPAAPASMPRRPPARSDRTIANVDDTDVEGLLRMRSDAPKPGGLAPPPPRPAPARGPVDERQLPTQPSQLKTRATLPSAPPLAQRRGSGLLLLLGFVALAAGSYAVWQLRSGTVARPAASAAEPAAVPLPREASTACLGTLVVADVPPHAEVLLHEGRAPVDVQRMPVGARLEFVATGDGYLPKRVVVPAGAGWDPGPDGKPRFEAAVQLDVSRARPTPNSDPWPAGEPGSAVGGEGPPGTVHVVATPRGAEVWMLAGIGPEARIEHLRCDQDIDVLLAGPTTYRKRLHVAASDFVPDDTPRIGVSNATMRIARVSGK